MNSFTRVIARFLFAAFAVAALAQGEPIGIVIMHGKGGSPNRLVSELARSLEGKGYLVANLEMPWSGNRNYDVPVGKAEEEVATAVAGLRGKGAKKVFISGHSQGGVFALYLAGKLSAEGFIAISPGGSVSARIYREKLSDSLVRARQLVAEGKGSEPARLEDYEGSRGTYPVIAVPAAYVTWFDPEGAMSMDRSVRAANPQIPVLFTVAKRDYPGLRNINPPMFGALPPNPLNKYYETDSDHKDAPTAAVDEIVRWTRAVAGAAKP